MNKTTHTHRGTCQACGSVQAVDNASGLVAKHGYTVEGHYFNGTCQGSGKKPAEWNTAFTHTIIAFCVETAAGHDDGITDLMNGTVVPKTFARYNPLKVVTHKSGNGGYDILPIALAGQGERVKAIQLAIHEHEMHAADLRRHADRLTRDVLPRLGKPLYAVADMVPAAKPAAPMVDVKTATVVGTFRTKAARKDALDKLSRQYDKAVDVIQNVYLALPAGERTQAKTEIYYSFSGLHNWNARRAADVLAEFPSLADTVAQIDALYLAREAVKCAP